VAAERCFDGAPKRLVSAERCVVAAQRRASAFNEEIETRRHGHGERSVAANAELPPLAAWR